MSSLYTVESRCDPAEACGADSAPGSIFAERYEIKAQLDSAGGGDHYLARDRVEEPMCP